MGPQHALLCRHCRDLVLGADCSSHRAAGRPLRSPVVDVHRVAGGRDLLPAVVWSQLGVAILRRLCCRPGRVQPGADRPGTADRRRKLLSPPPQHRTGNGFHLPTHCRGDKHPALCPNSPGTDLAGGVSVPWILQHGAGSSGGPAHASPPRGHRPAARRRGGVRPIGPVWKTCPSTHRGQLDGEGSGEDPNLLVDRRHRVRGDAGIQQRGLQPGAVPRGGRWSQCRRCRRCA